jgi:4-hydroxy-tetrahydrodipicolinate synthase
MHASTTLTLSVIENICGIKEASGDMNQCMQILRDRPDGFAVLSGDDALALPQMACGMDGVISVAANGFPARFSDMIRACLAGDFVQAKKLNDTLMEAYDLMFAENNPAGIKAFLTAMGIMENHFRLPIVPVSHGLMEKIKIFCSK